MTKIQRIVILTSLALMGLALIGGCFDPAPAEIGLKTTVQSQARACNVLVFNSKGRQIQSERADEHGVAYVKGLSPDTYTLKFQGSDNKMYAAVRTVKVEAGGNAYLNVDLEAATDKAGEAAAGGSGAGGGDTSGGGGTDD